MPQYSAVLHLKLPQRVVALWFLILKKTEQKPFRKKKIKMCYQPATMREALSTHSVVCTCKLPPPTVCTNVFILWRVAAVGRLKASR